MLAKHDENYTAREVIETLKKQGRWHETSARNAIRTKGTAM